MLAVFAITAPVFAMLFLGVVLRRLGLIDAHFIHTASALVFNVSMPVMLFLAILHADLSTALQPALLAYFLLATLLGFLLAWGWAILRVPRVERGVYVQGRFAATTASSAWPWPPACMATTACRWAASSAAW
jgi:malate permease and related proteins